MESVCSSTREVHRPFGTATSVSAGATTVGSDLPAEPRIAVVISYKKPDLIMHNAYVLLTVELVRSPS